MICNFKLNCASRDSTGYYKPSRATLKSDWLMVFQRESNEESNDCSYALNMRTAFKMILFSY